MPRNGSKSVSQDTSSSLLSSVFTFVSREIDSFVSSATGRPPREDEEDEDEYEDEEDEQPQASSSLSQPEMREVGRPERKAVRNETRGVVGKALQETEIAGRKTLRTRTRSRSRSRRHEHRLSDGEGESSRRQKKVASSPLTPRPTRRVPRPSSSDEEELAGSDASCTASPAPSLRRLRNKHSSFTMPGALYDRTSSLEPTPEPERERSRVVRFAPDVSESPPRKQSETPRSLRQHKETVADPSSSRSMLSSHNRQTRMPSDDEYPSQDEASAPSSPTRRPPQPAGKFVREAVRLHSQDENPDVSLLLPRSSAPVVWSSPTKGKGKERASSEIINVDDSDNEWSNEEQKRPSQPDISVTTRMKGKERELHTARQHDERRALSNADDDERARDKERIRVLEEELKKLREELARRPSTSQTSYIPPPPPPPPPPPATISSRSQTKQPSSTFADVRASLRHAGTPQEKPINPVVYGAASARKGQPTIVGADMMATFLNEMKTHRLRKVGASSAEGSSATSASRSQPAIRVREVGEVGNRSEVVLRPREIEDIGNRSEFLPRPSRSFAAPASEQHSNESSGEPPSRTRKATLSSASRSQDIQSRFGKDICVAKVSKRKHSEISHEPSQDPLPSKRRILESSTLARDSSRDTSNILSSSLLRESRRPISSGHDDGTSLSVQRQRSHLSNSGSNVSSIPNVRTGYITTPSLSSDNEQDSGSHEGRSPPTPPISEAMAFQGDHPTSGVADAAVGEARYMSQEAEFDNLESYQPEERQSRVRAVPRIQETPQMAASFAKRLPASPRLVDSPRRPRRPARARVVKEVYHPEDEQGRDEDPLSLSYTTTDDPLYARPEEREEDSQMTNAPESPPLRLPIRPPPGTFKPPKPRSIPPTRLPIRQSAQKSKLLQATARVPSTLRRKDSLDLELRRAEAAYEAEVLNDDVEQESGTFTGQGLWSRKQGFLAYGGAGGPPAVMGPGTVEDLENAEDSDDEALMPRLSRSMGRPSSTRRVH